MTRRNTTSLLSVSWLMMGLCLLSAPSGRSVGTGTVVPVPEWITAGPNARTRQVVYFRKTFEAKGGLLKAVVLGACEGRMTVYLNGQPITGISGREQVGSVDVTKHVIPGANVLALQAVNPQGVPAVGLLLEMIDPQGKQRWLISDGSWLTSLVETKDWNQPAFDANGWTSAVSRGQVDADPKRNPFDQKRAFDAYNSWKLASGAGAATDPATLQAPPLFKVELLRSAQPEEDSWVSLAFDPQGRLTVAREKRGLLRLTLGQTSVEQVEVIDDTLLECRGLLYAFGSLYANANNSKGFYRLRDTNGDDRFDQVELLLKTGGGVGHGRNHLKLGPDNMIYLAHGNNVQLPPALQNQPPHRNFQEDQLLPNPWDARMFDGNMVAPAGHILRTDRDGKTWQMVAGGFRNELDVAFNPDGEMFTYDADMEGDVAAPWYRPTRINHVISAGEYGWRRGGGKFPAYYADSLPSNHDIGVGSPTGIEFGTHSHFPPPYREALFISDWSYGRIIAVHLHPRGASYGAISETFVSGRPLNVTDLAFGPDGAMYFITGGRRTQSGLYRVSYLGARNQKLRKSAEALARERQAAKDRELRHQLESFHRDPKPGESPVIVATVWPHLHHPDFWIRYAARIALEQQPARFWQDKALAETQVDARLTALMALARTGESRLQTPLVTRLNELPLATLTEARQLHALRDYALAFIRMGTPAPEVEAAVRAKLEPLYPSPHRWVNHELCELLVYLKSPSVIAKTLDLAAQAGTSEDLMQYLMFLRYVPEGWTPDQRKAFFQALDRLDRFHGGRQFAAAQQDIRADVAARLSKDELTALGPLVERKVAPPPMAASTGLPLVFVKEWRMEDFLPLLDQAGQRRSFANGRAAFIAAQCVACHRLGNDPETAGGSFGPDLTAVASRFNRRDLLDSILNPSKVIDDKYRNTVFDLRDGESVSGLVEQEDDQSVSVRTDPLSGQPTRLLKADIRRRAPSEVSPMPVGLLNILQREQVLDLLTYLESGGNPRATAFQR